jgi:hypothetical protein
VSAVAACGTLTAADDQAPGADAAATDDAIPLDGPPLDGAAPDASRDGGGARGCLDAGDVFCESFDDGGAPWSFTFDHIDPSSTIAPSSSMVKSLPSAALVHVSLGGSDATLTKSIAIGPAGTQRLRIAFWMFIAFDDGASSTYLTVTLGSRLVILTRSKLVTPSDDGGSPTSTTFPIALQSSSWLAIDLEAALDTGSVDLWVGPSHLASLATTAMIVSSQTTIELKVGVSTSGPVAAPTEVYFDDVAAGWWP